MADFFSMGGYGAFVWPSFGVTTFVLLAIWAMSRVSLKNREAELATLQKQTGKAD